MKIGIMKPVRSVWLDKYLKNHFLQILGIGELGVLMNIAKSTKTTITSTSEKSSPLLLFQAIGRLITVVSQIRIRIILIFVKFVVGFQPIVKEIIIKIWLIRTVRS